jgi:hypothetical protein
MGRWMESSGGHACGGGWGVGVWAAAGVRVSAGEGKSDDYISSPRDLSHRSEMDGQNLCGLFGP